MNDKIDDIFRRNLGNVQVPPASSVKTGLVKEVSSIIYKKTFFCIAIITASVGVLAIASGLVFQNVNKASNELPQASPANNIGLLSSSNSSNPVTSVSNSLINKEDSEIECVEDEKLEELQPNSSELLAQKTYVPNKTSATKSQLNYLQKTISEASNSDSFSSKNFKNQTKRSGYGYKNESSISQFVEAGKHQDQLASNSKNESNLRRKTQNSDASDAKTKEIATLEKYTLDNLQPNLESSEVIPNLANSEFSAENKTVDNNILKSSPLNKNSLKTNNELIELDKVYSALNSEADNNPTDILNSNPFDFKSNRRLWTLGLSYGYGDYSNSLHSSNQNDDVKNATSINSKSKYLSAFASREVGRLKFSIGAGIERMNQSYSVSIIQSTQEEVGSYLDTYETVIINGNPTEVYVGQEYVTSLVDKEEEIISDLANQIDYLQIPFSVGYDLFRGSRFDAGFSAGIIYNHQLSSNGDVLNELSGGINSLNLDKSLAKKSLWQYQLGLNINRSITPRVSVGVNPRLRIASSKQFDELRIQSTNYSGLDINFGLQIKL